MDKKKNSILKKINMSIRGKQMVEIQNYGDSSEKVS